MSSLAFRVFGLGVRLACVLALSVVGLTSACGEEAGSARKMERPDGGRQAAAGGGEKKGAKSPEEDAARTLLEILNAAPLSKELSPETRKALDEIAELLKQDNTEDAREAWKKIVTATSHAPKKGEMDPWIAHLVREGTLKSAGELRGSVAGLAKTSARREIIRAHIRKLRDAAEVLRYNEKAEIGEIEIVEDPETGLPAAKALKKEMLEKKEITARADRWSMNLTELKEQAAREKADFDNLIESSAPMLKRMTEAVEMLRSSVREGRK